MPETPIVDHVRLPCGHTHPAVNGTAHCAHDGRQFILRHKPGRWEAQEVGR